MRSIKFKSILFLILLISLSLYAFDVEIPKEIRDMGFNESNLIDYEKLNDTEVFTFLDWTSEISGDTVSFIVKRGKIVRVIDELEK